MLGHDNLEWRGKYLYRRGIRSGKPLAGIEAVGNNCPGMLRVCRIDGRIISEMLNRTRARDLAESMALAKLNAGEKAAEAA